MDMVMCMVDIMGRGRLMVMDMVDTLVDITEREKLMVMDTDMVDTIVDTLVDIMERGKHLVTDMGITMVDIMESEKLMVMDTDMLDTMVDMVMVMVKDQLLKKTLQTTYLPPLRDICGIWRTFMSRNGNEEVNERGLVWGGVGYRLENIWQS